MLGMRLLHASLILIGTALASCYEQPARKLTATVVDIAPRVSRWHADEVLVTARSSDGLTGEKAVNVALLTCRVGDRVEATARGISLTLDGRACVR